MNDRVTEFMQALQIAQTDETPVVGYAVQFGQFIAKECVRRYG
ncbi:MAG: hypothetical protein R3E08_04705 [Thiotrichaceae bacterium]